MAKHIEHRITLRFQQTANVGGHFPLSAAEIISTLMTDGVATVDEVVLFSGISVDQTVTIDEVA